VAPVNSGTIKVASAHPAKGWRFLDRLVSWPHAGRFMLKSGVLLAAYDARRPTRDSCTGTDTAVFCSQMHRAAW
jgi:hypothetical protein